MQLRTILLSAFSVWVFITTVFSQPSKQIPIVKIGTTAKITEDKSLSSERKNSKDSIVISIQKFDELTKLLNKDDGVMKNILPSIIALLVVIISTWGAIKIGKKQIEAQTTSGEQQIRSQEAQAQEQLKVSREQIQETSKMTLAQVRANNISAARISWIQDLRNDLSQFNGEVAIINYYLRDVVALTKEQKEGDAKDLYNKQVERIKSARQFAFKIKLFLNKGEDNHNKLEKLIDNYLKTALENYETVNNDFNKTSDSILEISRTILKEAWEQAKNEGA